MPIRVLDSKTVSQIAAGEVIERPASVVKELVENALDAGANQLVIEVSGGGTSLIRVTDNGSGIAPAEAEVAFARHATSKISSVSDLDSIGSLGFRGEALPSIAAVARVDMVTAAAGETTATSLTLRDGTVVDHRSQARSPGTTVTVSQLFAQVPARLKFLKSKSTENGHISHVVSQYALAFPEVRFVLTIDGREGLRTPGSGQLIDSIAAVYGVKVAPNILSINSEIWDTGAAVAPLVDGMVGSPVIARASRNYLSFFINRRWVSSRLLTRAVVEAYHNLLPVGKYPLAILNISLPSQELDVNIHPAKSEVRFHQESVVFTAVQRVVRRTLVAQAPVPQIEEVATTYSAPPPTPKLWPSAATPATRSIPAPAPTPAASLPILRVLGQLDRSYIVAEGSAGLYLIDQHAAHERVLFEQISGNRAGNDIEAQGLLPPATIEVDPRQAEILQSGSQRLTALGFTAEPFGDRTYMIRTIPAMLWKQDWRAALRELMEDLATTRGSSGHWQERTATTLACHSAVRAGQVLSHEEMRQLLQQLEQAAIPHTCPHGRPTMIHLSSAQLAREFKRS